MEKTKKLRYALLAGVVVSALVLTVVASAKQNVISDNLKTATISTDTANGVVDSTVNGDSDKIVLPAFTCGDSYKGSGGDNQLCSQCTDMSGNSWESCWDATYQECYDEKCENGQCCKTCTQPGVEGTYQDCWKEGGYTPPVDRDKIVLPAFTCGENYKGTVNNQICSKCTDMSGNSWEECWDEKDDDSDKIVLPAFTCGENYKGTVNNQICSKCTDMSGNSWEECWDEKDDDSGNNNIAEPYELARQMKDMSRQLKELTNNAGKEVSRLEKEVSQVKREAEKRISNMEKLISRLESKKADTADAKASLVWYKERLDYAVYVQSQVANVKSNFQQDLVNAQTKYQTLKSGVSTWDDLNSVWGAIQLTDVIWPHQNAVQNMMTFMHESNDPANWLFEVEKMRLEASQSGGAVHECIAEYKSKIEDIKKFAPKLKEAYEKVNGMILDLRTLTDSEDIRFAKEDIQMEADDMRWLSEDFRDVVNDWRGNNDFGGERNGAWECQQKAWKFLEQGRRASESKEELAKIKQDLLLIDELVNNVSTNDPKVTDALNTLTQLKEKASGIVDALERAVDKGDFEVMENLWRTLDSVGQVADKALGVIRNYCERNDSACNLSEDVRKVMYEKRGGGDKDFRAELGNTYLDDDIVDNFLKQFEQKLNEKLDAIIQQSINLIQESVMQKVLAHMEDMIIEKVMTPLFEHLDILKEKGSEVAESSSDVYDVLAQLDEVEDKSAGLSSLITELKETPYVASTKDEIVNVLNTTYEAAQSGESTTSDEASLRNLLEKNAIALADEKVEFKDVRLKDNAWYYQYVIAVPSNIIGGHPDKTFKPGDLTNKCEATKMFLEAAGVGGKSGAGGDWCEPYRAMARDRGFAIASTKNWGEPITRGELATLIYEIGGFSKVPYSGEFPDVKTGDPIADVAATLNSEGIITGTGAGTFDARGNADRAQVATMVTRFLNANQDEQLFNELDNFDINDLEGFVDGEESVEGVMPGF